jgi:hypothetical protein
MPDPTRAKYPCRPGASAPEPLVNDEYLHARVTTWYEIVARVRMPQHT